MLLAEDLLAYLGYNHIRVRYQEERAHDNEISSDIVYKLINHVGTFASINHSFEANGSFIKMGARYFDELNKRLLYSVQASLGVNVGYVADGHYGLNHVQLRANSSYHPDKNFEFYLYAAYNKSINRDAIQYAGDETLDDFFWGGAGLNYLF